MKLLNATTIAAIALTGALSLGTASAAGFDAGVKPLSSVVGISSTNIKVKVEDGAATVYGFVDSNHEISLAVAHVEKMEGVDRVINRIVRN